MYLFLIVYEYFLSLIRFLSMHYFKGKFFVVKLIYTNFFNKIFTQSIASTENLCIFSREKL